MEIQSLEIFESNARRCQQKAMQMVRKERKLRDKIASLASRLSTIEQNMDRCLIDHSIAECRQLCEMIQIKLPREIRDMIYWYLSTYDSVEIQRDGSTEPSYRQQISFRKTRVKTRAVQKLGEDTLHELVENYYRTSSSMLYPKGYNGLTAFLDRGNTIQGITPTDYISTVHFRIPTYIILNSPGSRRELDSLRKGMQSLLKVPSRVKFHFVFVTSIISSRAAFQTRLGHLARILGSVFPALHALKNAGYKFTIRFDKKNVSCDKPEFSVQRLIKDYKEQRELERFQTNEEHGDGEEDDEEEMSDDEEEMSDDDQEEEMSSYDEEVSDNEEESQDDGNEMLDAEEEMSTDEEEMSDAAKLNLHLDLEAIRNDRRCR
ncbi:hypothetical protein K491DRAFT_685534 [Lophiostoma macrostomum CBS 122681]|uniref:Uncharacterized protein n=1 Tax=Lophiostoma macrostomum CBS 122681 TaxID=1314788 RepID=A0A6A6SIN1_9PLEO|nr:hypothetical protein K491DRAFT_685534 [Lophiostoma macrostomum CBS 122681]